MEETLLARLKEAAPGRVWLAGSLLYRGDDARRLARLAAAARAAGIPLIATNDVHFHHPGHERLVRFIHA